MKSKNSDKENGAKQARQATTHSPLSKWVREPLIHFYVLGLVVSGLHAVLEKKPESADDR